LKRLYDILHTMNSKTKELVVWIWTLIPLLMKNKITKVNIPIIEHKLVTKHWSMYFSFLVFLLKIFLAMGATSGSLKYIFELWRHLSNEQVGKEWACLETKRIEKNALHPSPKTFRSHNFSHFLFVLNDPKGYGCTNLSSTIPLWTLETTKLYPRILSSKPLPYQTKQLLFQIEH
jgi:hypothetical protein